MTNQKPPLETIEDIILDKDKRSMTALRPYLSPTFCMDAAKFIYARPGPAFIVTGFYEIKPQTIETDGPPGAWAIGHALSKLDRQVIFVSDQYCVPFLESETYGDESVEEFPIDGPTQSLAFANELLNQYKPSIVVAIERCSLTEKDRYLNMSGQDISEYTARLDSLFTEHTDTVGIGDGGNEIGMGNLAEIIPTIAALPNEPSQTKTTHLIIASVSNWGGYGLAAALSILAKKDLLPTSEEESARILGMVERGAVDGNILEPIPSVDGFMLKDNLGVLERLRKVVEASI